MKSLFLILTILLFQNTIAKATTVSPKFSYRQQERIGKGFNLELYQLTRHFEDQDLSPLSSFSSGDIPYLHVDEVLTTSDDHGLVFIKMGLLAPTDLQNKIIELKNSNESFYVFHINNASVAFFNLSEQKVKNLIKGLADKNIVFSNFGEFFISKAQASDQVVCPVQLINNPYKNIEIVASKVENSFLYKRIGECAVTALKEARKNVEETAGFFKSLYNNPAEFWTTIKNGYLGLQSFAINFTTELQSLFQTISGLNMDEKIDIACTLAGQAGVGLAMSLTGAGIAMGGAKIIATLIPKMVRMKDLIIKFQRFKIPLKTAQETLSCAI